MADRMCDRKPVLTWLSWQKINFFYRSLWDLRSRRCRCHTHSHDNQKNERVGYGQIHPRRCNRMMLYTSAERHWSSCHNTRAEPLGKQRDVNSVLMLLLNCLLDKQGTVLCSMLCVYFRKGTPIWGLRGPKMNGRDGCSLNLARLNVQQEILLFESTYECLFNLGYFNVPGVDF